MPPAPPDAAPGGMPSPDQIRSEVEAALPEPTKGYYSYAKVEKVAKSATDALRTMLKGKADIPDVACPKDNVQGNRLMGKLPAEVMVPALLAIDYAVTLGGEAGARFAVEPSELVDDSALDMLIAKLKLIAKDKKLAKALKGGDAPPAKAAPAPKAAPPEPPPGAAAYL